MNCALSLVLRPGRPRARARCWFAFAALALLWSRSPASPAHAQDCAAECQALLGRFAKMPGLSAQFTEEKRIALLAKPLVSRGTLLFAPPGLLLRRIEAPRASELVITPDEVRIKDEAGVQRIDLRARDDLRPFIESLTWLLSGNHKALSAAYQTAFQSLPKAGFELTLRPRAEPISKLIEFIRIRGSGASVAEILVRERSGDETLTRITAADPQRRFSPAELRDLFGYGGR